MKNLELQQKRMVLIPSLDSFPDRVCGSIVYVPGTGVGWGGVVVIFWLYSRHSLFESSWLSQQIVLMMASRRCIQNMEAMKCKVSGLLDYLPFLKWL